MTREEAISKFTLESDLDDLAPAIVDGLEALGLLKLDPIPLTLWELLRKHGVALDRAQAICNDALHGGVAVPVNGAVSTPPKGARMAEHTPTPWRCVPGEQETA